MCEFCVKHGEGKKWYEIMENYSQELLSQKSREKFPVELLLMVERYGIKGLNRLEWAKAKLPFAHRFIKKIGTWGMKQYHFGQVVPLEDAEKIMDLVQSITRLPCVCRKTVSGKPNARFCLAFGIDPSGMLAGYPDLKASLETLSREQAKELLRDFDQAGLVHSIWTFKTPFIAGLCNCDDNCLAYKTQITSDLMQVMFKAEYIAAIESTGCIGCRKCEELCKFGAVDFSVKDQKCTVNRLKCYGCGVCRSSCPKQAITLVNRI